MKNIIFICMFFLLVSCGPSFNIKPQVNIIECPAPEAPKYQQLDNSTHIASDKNLLILMNDLNIQKTYIKLQNSTIECYKRQLPKEAK